MLLVIYSLGGGHTDTYTHRRQNQFLETRCAPGLKTAYDGFLI